MNNTALTNTLAIIVVMIAGIALGVCIILGADQGDFALIAIGATPLATALGAVVDRYFSNKTIATKDATIEALKVQLGNNK